MAARQRCSAMAGSLGNTPLLWSHTEAARSLHQLTRERIRHRYGTAAYRAWRIARYIRLRLSV